MTLFQYLEHWCFTKLVEQFRLPVPKENHATVRY